MFSIHKFQIIGGVIRKLGVHDLIMAVDYVILKTIVLMLCTIIDMITGAISSICINKPNSIKPSLCSNQYMVSYVNLYAL